MREVDVSWWRRWFGRSAVDTETSSDDGLPAGPVVDVLATWLVAPAEDGSAMVVRYGRNVAGALTIDTEGGVEGAAEFLAYYLLDPMNTRPVYLEGLGPQPGPHTRDPEQFESAMATYAMRFPAWKAWRLAD